MLIPSPISIFVVTSEIIIPVIVDSFKRVPANDIGYIIVECLCPRPIIVGRRVPYVSNAEIEEVAQEEKIIRHSRCNIKPHFRRLDKFGGLLYNHRLRDIDRRLIRTWISEIDPDTETDVRSVRLCNRRQQDKRHAKQQFSHLGLLSGPPSSRFNPDPDTLYLTYKTKNNR